MGDGFQVGQRVRINDAAWEKTSAVIGSPPSLSREGAITQIDPVPLHRPRGHIRRPRKVTVRHDKGEDMADGEGERFEWGWSVSDLEAL